MKSILKDKSGVTLVVLIITVIVLLILTGIIVTSGTGLTESMQRRRQIAMLNLVQTKVKILGEEARFSSNTSALKGKTYRRHLTHPSWTLK